MERRERFDRAVLLAVAALPEALRRRVVGHPLPRWEGVALDSRIAALMALTERNGRSFRADVSVPTFRANYARTNRVCGIHERGAVTTRALSIETDDGVIGARLYRPGTPSRSGTLPLLVFFHGGGYVVGDVAAYDGLTRFFAVQGNIAVLSVDYRLGPEHRFPRAHEDAFAAFAWAQRHAADLGVDPARIAVGGDSAGGGIAVAIATYAVERGLVSPAFSFPIYPAVDTSDHYPSRRAFDAGLPLTRETIRWFSMRYGTSRADFDSPLFSPLRATSLAHTPPTYLLAAGFDPLENEGRAYADRLRAQGVPVTYDRRPTLSHAFVNLAGVVPEAKRALREAIRAVASAL